MEKISPDCVTQLNYLSFGDSSFFVLSNQATIIAVSKADYKTIIKENITDHSEPVVTYTANTGRVYTLAADEANNMLFAGSSNFDDGQVVQYDLANGQAIKNYFNVGIDCVLSNFRMKNIWIWGGRGLSKFVVIDSMTRQLVGEPVTTAINNICSLKVCKVFKNKQNQKVILIIVGKFSNYSNKRTDLFDITQLLSLHLFKGQCKIQNSVDVQPLEGK